PPGSLFLLTTVDSRRLLPTIRSRAVALRLNRLTDGEVRGFLETSVRRRPSAAEMEQRVAAAEGAIGKGLGGGSATMKAREAAHQLLEAVLAGPGPAL